MADQERQLKAIMFSDVKSFSAMMAENEERTMLLIKEHRTIIRGVLPRFGGEEHGTAGDSFFVLFGSAVLAVQCAVEIQEAFHRRNSEHGEDEQIWIRIGIHIGDIIVDKSENRVYGEGINIAARTEPQAEPGGICITQDVFQQVGNKLALRVISIGKQEMKNIVNAPELYRIIVGQVGSPPEVNKRASPPVPRLAVAAVAGAVLVAGVGVALWRYASHASAAPTLPDGSPSSASVASSPGVPITSLPLPKSGHAAALDAYKRGLQAFRDASWETAHRCFREAVEADPKLAEAHMRVALASIGLLTPPKDAKDSFRQAALLRATMGARDQDLLQAVEPYLLTDPPDLPETTRRLRAATDQHPGDAELWMLLSCMLLQQGKPAESLEAAERSLAYDERYADAWQLKGASMAQAGRLDAAREALNHCAALSPLAVDCQLDLAYLASYAGDCGGALSRARAGLTANPSSLYSHVLACSANAALGKPDDAVLNALQLAWQRQEQPIRDRYNLEWTARLRALRGDFQQARALLGQELRAMEGSAQGGSQQDAWGLLLRIQLEAGDKKGAESVARAYFKQEAGWTASAESLNPLEAGGGPLSDPSLVMWRALREAGAVNDDKLEEQRRSLTAGWRARGSDERLVWLGGWAAPAWSADEAKTALEHMPQDMSADPYYRSPEAAALLGRVYALANLPEKATPLLEQAVAGCWGLVNPMLHTASSRYLGNVYESVGKTQEACRAYARVIERWGTAKPSSATARYASQRSRALNCED